MGTKNEKRILIDNEIIKIISSKKCRFGTLSRKECPNEAVLSIRIFSKWYNIHFTKSNWDELNQWMNDSLNKHVI